MAQLLGSVEAVGVVEVKAAVRFLPRYVGQTTELTNSHGKASFHLLKNSELKLVRGKIHCVGTVHFYFKNDISTDTWQQVAKLEEPLFEKEFVSNDAFVLKFTEARASGD